MDKINDYEQMKYRKFTLKSEIDKALHTLEGILKGIAIDKLINVNEVKEVKEWHINYSYYVKYHPFSELIPCIGRSIQDNYLDDEEIKNILWLCENFKTGSEYFDIITSDIQKLEGILHGILSDNDISFDEIVGLKKWLSENEHLIQSYPYDEIYSLCISVLSDGKLDDAEKNILKVFFSDFVNHEITNIINIDEINTLKKELCLEGICSICPEIEINDKVFCFSGVSSKTTRKGFANIIETLNGVFNNNVTLSTDYLVVGNEGNPCWAFSCYGRKVEKAVNLRKNGHKILIVNENDFWDYVEDYQAGIS